MELKEAIEISKEVQQGRADLGCLEDAVAIQLLIEAGREVIALRNVLTGLGKSLLPGETLKKE